MCGNLGSVMLCETSQTPKTHSVRFYLYDILRMMDFTYMMSLDKES